MGVRGKMIAGAALLVAVIAAGTAGMVSCRDKIISVMNDITDVMHREEQETDIMNKPKIALTFDDGPHPYYTEQLLEGLKERDVKVTFFITGENAEAYPEIVQEMHEDGHLIGNHTYHHTQLNAGNAEAFK